MISKMSKTISVCMRKYNLIGEELEEEYSYAIETMSERIITYAAMILLSIAFEKLIPTIIFMLFFLSLRSRTGGFHMPSFITCFISTIIIYISFVKYLSPIFMDHEMYFLIVFIISAFVIMLLGAINHPNVGWNKEEYEESKKAARINVCLQVTCIIALGLINVNIDCIIYAAFAVILCAVLLCIAKINNQEE